jgi:Protein of unknown function (DUF3037)
MQEKYLFEYAVIHVVPKVERGEFINIGVVLYSAKLKYLKAVTDLNEKRLTAFSADIDLSELREYLRVYEEICAGGPGAGPIGKLPVAERFRWLTATRSTILQTSPVHTGLCNDADEMLMRLHKQLVLQ